MLAANLALVAATVQPTISVAGPASVYPGAASLTIAVSGSAGNNLAGLQFTITLPTGMTLGTPVVSPAWAANGFSIYCGTAVCVIINVTTITPTVADGTMATIPVNVAATVAPGSASISLTGTLGATGAGLNVTTSAGPAMSMKVLSFCDINGDGVVNLADVTIVIDAIIGTGTCPLTAGCSLQTVLAVVQNSLGGACTLTSH